MQGSARKHIYLVLVSKYEFLANNCIFLTWDSPLSGSGFRNFPSTKSRINTVMWSHGLVGINIQLLLYLHYYSQPKEHLNRWWQEYVLEIKCQKNTADWKWLCTAAVYKENCNDSENWRTYSQGNVFWPDMTCW